MAANTICMYFKCDPAALKDAGVWDKVKGLGELTLKPVVGEPVVVEMGSAEDKLFVFRGENQSQATIRVYSHGLVTIDIQHIYHDYELPLDAQLYNRQYIRALGKSIDEYLGELNTDSNIIFCPIRRGQPVWPYALTADERIQELDYDKLVFEKNSKYQNIRIFHSRQNGNVLFLDGDAMLGESDLIYTQTLCCIGEDDYTGKSVLILGGGDCGILHELLKEKPKFITMAEIDDEVIFACREHMRSVCGSDADKFEGPNYKIEITDCLKKMHDAIQSGNLYDVVINDLTEFPVEKHVKGFGYDFKTTSLITELSIKSVKPGGKMLARGNCLGADEYHQKFTDDLKTMGCEFKRKDVYVPSFEEVYCLYEIWKKQ